MIFFDYHAKRTAIDEHDQLRTRLITHSQQRSLLEICSKAQ